MSYRRLTIASAFVTLALAVIASLALSRLPAGTKLPTHWNGAGEADGFADAGTALFTPVALTMFLSAALLILPRIEPLQHGMDRSAGLLKAVWGASLGLMVLVEAVIAAPAFGHVLPTTLLLFGVGITLAIIGNALPKSRPGFFVGIRTPWTLTDPENWIATHRLGARTTVVAGLGIAVAAILPLTPAIRIDVLFAAVGLTMVPVVYSWWFWRTRRAA